MENVSHKVHKDKADFILTLTGPSGSGKTEMIQALKKTGLFEQLVSVTTRPKRPSEVDGVDYYFLTREEFEAMLVSSQRTYSLVQHVEFKGNYYGTTYLEVQRVLATGKIPMVVVEPSGVGQFEEAFKDSEYKVVPVFVDAPPKLLVSRYLDRLAGAVLEKKDVDYHATRLLGIVEESITWHDWVPEPVEDEELYEPIRWFTTIWNGGTMAEFETEINHFVEECLGLKPNQPTPQDHVSQS